MMKIFFGGISSLNFMDKNGLKNVFHHEMSPDWGFTMKNMVN
jgi:hypothetical protein